MVYVFFSMQESSNYPNGLYTDARNINLQCMELCIISQCFHRYLILFQCGTYTLITGINAKAVYQPVIPHGGPLVEGFGPEKDTFPLTQPVLFNISTTGEFAFHLRNQCALLAGNGVERQVYGRLGERACLPVVGFLLVSFIK